MHPRLWTYLLLIGLTGISWMAPAGVRGDIDRFQATLRAFAAMGDRTTGTAGNDAAVQSIGANFDALNLESVGSQVFATATREYGPARLALSRRPDPIPIHPLAANAISPNTTGPKGLSGPLVYVGNGDLGEMNGKPIEGAIVLMEMTSGRNWLHAASLGAKALIYIDRNDAAGYFFQEKLELSPVAFPRFWIPLARARQLLGQFESAAEGVVDPEARLNATARWRETTGRNLYALIPGNDPVLAAELVVVEAFYDTRAAVPGLAPGADESCGIATLLEMARELKERPARRSVLLVATGGNGQSQAGMREMVWSLAERSKYFQQLQKQLRREIKTRGKVLQSLGAGKGSSTPDLSEGSPAIDALHERIKTEVDSLSRRLMQLRLEPDSAGQQAGIGPLVDRRSALRSLGWQNAYPHPTPGERAILEHLLPMAVADQQAVLDSARAQLTYVRSAAEMRRLVRSYDLQAVVSLYLSSHGDGVGAFNQGWRYPLKSNINRVEAYVQLDDVLQAAGRRLDNPALAGLFKDTLRPNRKQPWQSQLPDHPRLGGEISALAGFLGITLASTHDMRVRWGTPHDTVERVDVANAFRQAVLVHHLITRLADAPRLRATASLRQGFATVAGRANFLRHGELFADQPAPGSVIMAFQGTTRYYTMVDAMGRFTLRGVADKKHVLNKVIIEGYRFDDDTGEVQWAIDKKQTGKPAYRVKMTRRFMETDLVMFACAQTTLFNLLEPRNFHYMTKIKLIDGRREASPQHYWYSRIDTRSSVITSTFLTPETRLKMTLSDNVLHRKLILLHADRENPLGRGYHVQKYPAVLRTDYRVARDMWALLAPRIENLERHGIFNQRIRDLRQQGEAALESAGTALARRQYDRFAEAASRSWALASRVYDDVERTQKDVLFGVLFYIALFAPFSFCMERLLFSFASIYKRILAFGAILLLLIFVIYQVHPAFQLAYSPMVVILAFFIMGLSLMVTLIIFLRFESEMTTLQSHARRLRAGELSHWKAFVAAFLLGVSNLRRRRLRTALTCLTLIILTFTIMSFTTVKTSRQHSRLLYQSGAPYHGFLLKNANWKSLPPEALGRLTNAFDATAWVAPRVWLESEDPTRATPMPIRYQGRRFEGFGLVGLGPEEGRVTGLDAILLQGRWFRNAAADELLLPDVMARNLGIDLTRSGPVPVTLWGQSFEVVGVFSADGLQQRTDLDGEPLTPVTFPREISTELTEVEMEALESGEDVVAFQSRYEHISGHRTLIMPYRTLLAAGGRLEAVAVRPRQEIDPAAMAADLVDRFGLALFSGEPGGTYLYNADDAIRYSGAPNIVIPLVISVFIVLNTMIGSVYERKREIGIYTSVGLAPSHVAFLFIAEAMAFAVISVVLGYLVAQTSAGLLSGTALWSGITVNYSSLSGVAAMALVILVVLVSVIYPAHVAAQIAIPDINRTWRLPPAQGNRLELKLPFLMKHHEHRSVGGFLHAFLQSHLDISHGVFSTGDIQLNFVCHTPEGPRAATAQAPDACVRLAARVWLAPFDLGIMQEAVFSFTPVAGEPEFLEISVALTRRSGEANAWHRINKAFLHHTRRQLLMWRSLGGREKQYYQDLLDGQAYNLIELRAGQDS